MNSNDHDHDDDEEEDASDLPPEELIIYSLDPHTHNLIEVACNCLITLSEAQLSEESAENLMAIADALAERFSIGRLEQEIHQTDDGEEEIIFKPDTSLFPEQPEDPEAK